MRVIAYIQYISDVTILFRDVKLRHQEKNTANEGLSLACIKRSKE